MLSCDAGNPPPLQANLTAAVLVPELLRTCRVIPATAIHSNSDQLPEDEQTDVVLPARLPISGADTGVGTKPHGVDGVGEVEDKAGMGSGVSSVHEINEHSSTIVGSGGETGNVDASSSGVPSARVDWDDRGSARDVSEGAGGLTPGSVAVDRAAGESASSTEEGAARFAGSPDGDSVSASDDRIILGGAEGRESAAVSADTTDVTAVGGAVSPREAETEDPRGDAAPESSRELVPAATAQADDKVHVSTSKDTLRAHSDESRVTGESDRNDATGSVVPSNESGVPLPGSSELSTATEDKDSGREADVAPTGQSESDAASGADVDEAEVGSSAAVPSPRKNSGKLWGWSLPAWAGGGGGKGD